MSLKTLNHKALRMKKIQTPASGTLIIIVVTYSLYIEFPQMT